MEKIERDLSARIDDILEECDALKHREKNLISDIKKRGDAARQLIMAKDEEIHKLKSKLVGSQISPSNTAAPDVGTSLSPTRKTEFFEKDNNAEAEVGTHESTERVDTSITVESNTNETKVAQRITSPPVMSTPVLNS